MNARQEYGLDDGDQTTKSNGNGKHPKFGIVPATDPDTLAILESRSKALGDPRLNRSERAFVCFVIDRALHPKFYDEKGVVCMADSIVADKLGVTTRTVYDWRNNTAIREYFWLSKKRKTNMWPMMVYHLTALHSPPRQDERTDADGTYAGGSDGRAGLDELAAAQGREKRNAKLKAKREQKSLPLTGGIAVITGSFGHRPKPQTHVLQAISAQFRKSLRPGAEMNFGPEPKPVSADSRNEFRPGAETSFGPEPKPASGLSRKKHRPGAEAGCQNKEPRKESEQVFQRGDRPPPPSEDAIWFENRWWYPSKLDRFLALLKEGINEAEPGLGRKLLKDREHACRVAMGLAVEKTATVKAEIAQITGPAHLPKEELAVYMKALREAAR